MPFQVTIAKTPATKKNTVAIIGTLKISDPGQYGIQETRFGSVPDLQMSTATAPPNGARKQAV